MVMKQFFTFNIDNITILVSKFSCACRGGPKDGTHHHGCGRRVRQPVCTLKLLIQENNVRAYKSGEAALAALEENPKPDLILLNIMMPGLDGFATLSRIHDRPETRNIPVIFITSLDSPKYEDKGFRLGAVDYITKPFKPSTVLARVNAHLELKEARDRLKDQNRWLEAEVEKRLEEIHLVQTSSLTALMRLAETRDENTGNHIRRTSKYVEALALAMKTNPKYTDQLNDEKIRSIVRASQLHDVGKIGISDQILRKPGKLTKEEFEVIKTHCEIGASALNSAKNEALMYLSPEMKTTMIPALQFLEDAEIIALNHHEKWDGTGYPAGKKQLQIPLSARLIALADVFDALTTARPYKIAWMMEETVSFILGQEGKAFDPDVVAAFKDRLDEFRQIMTDFADADTKDG